MLKKINALLLVLFSAFLISCGNDKSNQNEKVNYPERTEKNEIVLRSHQLSHVDLQTQIVEIKEVDGPLLLSGRIALNEALTAHITARVRGRIEKVSALISDRVRKGETLLELYSQDFIAMQSEFIQAEERFKRTKSSDQDYGTAKSIYESAKKKLEVVGLTENEIEQLANTHTPYTVIPVRAPFDGTLISGEARLGEFVDVGKEFFLLANIYNLWALADVFEKDLPLIKEGMIGEITASSYSDEIYKAKLTRIYDVVESSSRTVKARFDLNNPKGKLKPEMFISVKVNSKLGGMNPKVSSSAVMKEKSGTYLFVVMNDTTFQRREIQIGKETKEFTEILSGLKAGEKVVTRGTFYLKSELSKKTFMED
jgi:Cu(I)/Ag(I) efflux system membrane fusion protein